MIFGVTRESFPGERRVALVPASLLTLNDNGAEVLVEKGAGGAAGYEDDAYRDNGAQIVDNRNQIFNSADFILQVRGLGANPHAGRVDLEHQKSGQGLISFLDPLTALQEVKEIARAGIIAFAMELMPRVTRAQSMDALTSMAAISGYKAVLFAAEVLPRMFPMMMTAAGTIMPAKVLVVGAGVAGLQAIATARRLGSVVQAYDIRPAVREEIESLGARYVDLPIEAEDTESKGGYAKEMKDDFYRLQRETLAHAVIQSDVVITTAAVPGKSAPVLIDGDMVKAMRAGSVIVDVAAERGGNCELTSPGETKVVQDVTIIGHTNIPSTVPHDASQMYSKNIVSFMTTMLDHGHLNLDYEDEIIRETLVTNGGQVVHPKVKELIEAKDSIHSG